MIAEKTSNRLINEKSPYLLQHVHNPVDWYPWGEEAFEKARTEDKPVFLSIGYSTCHWCHVMERESFEKYDVAEVLNSSFVAIKVDREERPDIDSIYINVCQMMTGSAGWPLSIFMDCDKRPFFAGTYFPNNDSNGRVGFIPLLKSVKKAWDENRDELIQSSERVISVLRPKENQRLPIDRSFPDAVFRALEHSFDRKYGGFSPPPKFPSPNALLFLVRYYAATGEITALEMCRTTLDSMRRGGIFDHIGFGFSRYSTDRKWLIPHFEKMLYDNALLCIAYSELYSITKDDAYARTAKEVIYYLSSRMLSESGGFFTSEDADSEGVEGKYYVFSVEEVERVLGEDSDEFCRLYDITDQGNFEGKNILNLLNSDTPADKKEFAEKCRLALWDYREKRVRPHLDDKMLTSQNGLMIAALAIAGRTFHDEGYLQMAKDVVDFIKSNMLSKNGTLLARYRDGEARFLGYDEDYAFTVWGLLELYQSCLDPNHLELADSLNRVFLSRYFDYESGGFYQTDIGAEKQIYRPKNIYDGTTPSANSIAVFNLMRLARLKGDDELLETAKRCIEGIMEELKLIPAAYPFHAINILYDTDGGTDIALRSNDVSSLKDMLEVINNKYRPFITVRALLNNQENDEEHVKYQMVNDMPTAYVCRDRSCKPPVSSPDELGAMLE